MNTNINIAYTLNNNNYLMTFVSMQSVLENNKNNTINFYLVFDNTFESVFGQIFDKFKGYLNCNIFFVTENIQKYSKIETFSRYIEMSYVFDFANLIDQDRVLYLHSDTFITCDLREFFNQDLTGYSCSAPEYIYSESLRNDYNLSNSILFHNTVLLIDLKKWKENKIFEKFLHFNYKKYLVSSELHAGVFFNIIIDDCKMADISFNYTETNANWKSHLPISCSGQTKILYKQIECHSVMPNIVTFIGESPLSTKNCKNSYRNLWWEYAEKSPIYNEIKEFRESNQYKLKATSAANSFDYAWLLSRMMPYIKPYLPRIIIGFLIAIPLGLLDGVTALAIKPYMDYVIGNKVFEFAIFNHSFSINSILMAILIPLGIIIFAGVQGFLRYLNSYISSWTSIHITNDVKADLFHHLIHMHPQFFDDNPSGIIISRYVTDPQTASSGIVEQIKTITTSVFGALGLIAVMLYSSWQLAFIGVFVLCMAFIPVTILRKRMRMASNQNMVITGDITTNFNETYNGNKVMYAYELQDEREKTFRTQLKEFFDVNISLTKRTAWMSPMMYQIASIGIAIVLGVGTYLINAGHMTAGAFASFVTSLLLLYKPVKTLGNTLTGIQNIFVAMGRVFELFDLKPQIADKKGAIEFKGFNNSITFENVCFEYVPNKPVLKNINLTIKKNETLAIVGNSGGGKSTLVNLINRFYEIKSGSLKFDDTDIRDYSLNSLRSAISMVFQDNFLYSGTIKYNILMGNHNATEEDLQMAIKSAHLEDMIQKLPEGLDTSIGERGLTLSGGQRQRVAIARAMLRNAPIVILDEATSALDNESEAIVQKAMDNLMQNRTVFIIAHRLSTIKNADRIAVINDGELVELGSHDELMQIENGQYRHLYEMQFRHQEENTL